MIVRTKTPIYIKHGEVQSLILNGRAGIADPKGLLFWFSDQTNQVKVGFDKEVVLYSGMFNVTREIEDKEVSLRDVEMQLKDLQVPEEVINELKMRL